MSDEKSLYSSLERGTASPSFATFCRGFRGAVVQELYVREDGTGLYLKAGDRSIDLVYKPGALNRVLAGSLGSPAGQLNWFPEGKEHLIREYLPPDVIEDAMIAVERPDVLRGLISILYEGKEIREAVLETRRSIALNLRGFRTPENTPFFFPSPIPTVFTDDAVSFFMEADAFVHATCEDGQTRTVYVPTEADR